jgi:hypothetical protein
MLPTYVAPDYSAQGLALKLNSSVPYQYIILVRSPIFFNTTFTISFWLYPNVEASIVYAIFTQIYANAPDLTVSITDQRIVLHVYNTNLWSTARLTNFQWQYVSCAFYQVDLSMAIFIDGILSSAGVIENPQYGNFETTETAIGVYTVYNPYNGLIDDLAISYRIKNRMDILNEATLVVQYTFDGNSENNDSLFNDISANAIRATGMDVTSVIGSRLTGHSTLYLYDPTVSYFQSSGFALLVTFNYTYSYAFWLNVANSSAVMPLVHVVARDEMSSAESNDTICLAMLAINTTNTCKFFF